MWLQAETWLAALFWAHVCDSYSFIVFFVVKRNNHFRVFIWNSKPWFSESCLEASLIILNILLSTLLNRILHSLIHWKVLIVLTMTTDISNCLHCNVDISLSRKKCKNCKRWIVVKKGRARFRPEATCLKKPSREIKEEYYKKIVALKNCLDDVWLLKEIDQFLGD